MQKIVGVTKLQRSFRLFFDKVAHEGESLILTRGSQPEAVLISYEDYQSFQQMQEKEVLARFDRVWDRLDELNAEYNDAEIAADIKAAR